MNSLPQVSWQRRQRQRQECLLWRQRQERASQPEATGKVSETGLRELPAWEEALEESVPSESRFPLLRESARSWILTSSGFFAEENRSMSNQAPVP